MSRLGRGGLAFALSAAGHAVVLAVVWLLWPAAARQPRVQVMSVELLETQASPLPASPQAPHAPATAPVPAPATMTARAAAPVPAPATTPARAAAPAPAPRSTPPVTIVPVHPGGEAPRAGASAADDVEILFAAGPFDPGAPVRLDLPAGAGAAPSKGGGPGGASDPGGGAGVNADGIRRSIQAAIRYPRLARKRGVEGEVLVRFRVAPGGRPVEIEIVDADDPLLADAAREAVERAAPFASSPGWVRVPVVFTLEP